MLHEDPSLCGDGIGGGSARGEWLLPHAGADARKLVLLAESEAAPHLDALDGAMGFAAAASAACGPLLEPVVEATRPVYDACGPLLEPMVDAAAAVTSPVVDAAGAVTKPVVEAAGAVTGAVSGAMTGAVAGAVSGAMTGAVAKPVADAAGPVSDVTGEWFERGVDYTGEALEKGIEATGAAVSGTCDAVVPAVQSGWDSVMTIALEPAWEATTNVLGGMGEAVGGMSEAVMTSGKNFLDGWMAQAPAADAVASDAPAAPAVAG